MPTTGLSYFLAIDLGIGYFMRRKSKYHAWFWSEYDKSKLEPGLLEAVGHLTFLWNDVEEALDRAVMWVMECPVALQVEIRSRINGLDGKIGIIKAAVAATEHIPANIKLDLLTTLGAFQIYKEGRDALIHAKASEIRNGIARTFERQGTVYEVLLTAKSVGSLNAHLEIYKKEMAALAGVLGGSTPTGRAMRKAPGFEQLIGQSDRRYLTTLLDCQHQRKGLQRLPEFPPETKSSVGTKQNGVRSQSEKAGRRTI